MKTPVIEFKDFSFRYKSQTEETLHDINLTIYEGEKVLLLGASGSGKTTLGNCINGLIPFSFPGVIKGSCKICGKETQGESIFAISNFVGTVQQDTDAQFVGLSVGEDIAFSLENDAVSRAEMLPKVEGAARVVGMEEFLGELPYSLSGGQKQKVALAGILHNNVKILLFDEPLAALDPAMGMAAVDLIDQVYRAQDKTVVIIEHRLEDVLYRHVDRIVLMHEGRILMDTTPDELLSSDILKENGIREPLYISALKHTGLHFSKKEHLEDIEELDYEKYKVSLQQAFHNVKIERREPEGETLLDVRNVDFFYGDHQVLKNVSFSVHRGERISVVGKNGAGKSTIARLVCGIIRPKNGEVQLKAQNYMKMSIRDIGRMVGYVMQNPNQMIVKDMIRDEVELAMKLNGFTEGVEERSEEVIKMCGLYAMRNWPVSVLSYGQKKRITIASILILKPELIILDEPTAGQDYKHYTEIMNFLEGLNRDHNITILFITHDMHLAIEYTDRSIVFADGECIADGPVYSVLSNEDIIRRANLKKTSLVTLAEHAGLNPENFIYNFIETERRARQNG